MKYLVCENWNWRHNKAVKAAIELGMSLDYLVGLTDNRRQPQVSRDQVG